MELIIYKEERQNLGEIAFISDTLNQIKIRDIKDENVFTIQLIKSMVLINTLAGIKEPISDIVKTDIKEMILSRFKTFSFDELSYAFKMERYGKLEPRTEHFQLFDAVYVSKVLEKYKKWKLEKRMQHNIKQSKTIEKKMTEEEKAFIMAEAVDRIKKEVEQNRTITSVCGHVYDYLFDLGKLPKDKETKDKVFERAKLIAKSEAMTKAAESYEEHVKLKGVIEKIEKGDSNVVTIAKRLILETYFTIL